MSFSPKAMFTLLILVSLLTQSVLTCDEERCRKYGTCALLYQIENFEGWSVCVYPLSQYGVDCETLNHWWQDYSSPMARVSSVNTYGNCVILWSEKGCKGDSRRVGPGSPSHNNLGAISFNDMTRSVSSCLLPNETTNASPSSCRNIQLFFGGDFHQIRSDSSLKTVIDVANGASIALSATPAAVITPIINGFTFVASLFQNLNIDERYKEARIDAKLTKAFAEHTQADMVHCKQMFSNMVPGTNLSTYVRDIEYCFNQMSTTLIRFENSVFRENPLVSSPYLVAYTPMLLITQTLTNQVTPRKLTSICQNTMKLINLLEDYRERSIKKRPELIRQGNFFWVYDHMTGKYVMEGGSWPASRGQAATYQPLMTICERDWLITIKNEMNKFFEPTINAALKHLNTFSECSK